MKKTHIVLFDMDHTLLLADTIGLWADFLDSKGILNEEERQKRLRFDEDYIHHRLDMEASYAFDLSLFLKVPITQRERWRQDFFEQCVRTKVSSTGLRLIHHYKSQPDTLVLLTTATHAFLATPVANYASVHALIATEEEIINGEYTGNISGIINMGEGKVKNFRSFLQQNQITPMHTILYSDSINDLPLLLEVNEPIVVDPDPRLLAIAQQRGWRIISLANADKTGDMIEPVVLGEKLA